MEPWVHVRDEACGEACPGSIEVEDPLPADAGVCSAELAEWIDLEGAVVPALDVGSPGL